MRWSAEHLETVSRVVEASRAGRPSVLVVEGKSGIGKSSVLDTVVASAHGFVVRRVECLPYQDPPAYGALSQLGIDTSSLAGPSSPPFVAQRIRAALDEWSIDGPVLLVVDDLQWADPESVEAIVAVLGRAEAERLLVVIATRPLGAADHIAFARWERRATNVHRIDLDGLDLEAARELLRSVRPAVSDDLADAIWRHAEGNPLYLRELAEEYDESQLADLPVLPAPTAYARAVTSRLHRLSANAVSLGRAAAVLGDGWNSLPDVAEVAQVDDGSVVDELLDARLMSARHGSDGTQLRFDHALVRSAVYLEIPPGARRALHLRAAATVAGQATVFEHRIAATLNYDDDLADELAQRAAELRADGEYRSGARYMHLSSTVTTNATIREQRWLDSLSDSMANGDTETVRASMKSIDDARDRRRRELILAQFAIRDSRPQVAARLLTPWAGADNKDVAQYRIEGLLAWALVVSDAPEDEVRGALERASTTPGVNAATARLIVMGRAQFAARNTDDLSAVAALAALPDDPQLVPIAATAALAWRGIVRVGLGHFRRSVLDLTEVTERMHAGALGFSAGTYHAILARAQWFGGDWARARVNLSAARELSDSSSHLVVIAALPLQAVGDGDLERAREQIVVARERLEQTRWREAVDQLAIVEVAFAHASTAVPCRRSRAARADA